MSSGNQSFTKTYTFLKDCSFILYAFTSSRENSSISTNLNNVILVKKLSEYQAMADTYLVAVYEAKKGGSITVTSGGYCGYNAGMMQGIVTDNINNYTVN